MREARCLYCAIDSCRTVIKIGVSEWPDGRALELSRNFAKSMKMIFVVEFACIHFESAEILNGHNYAISPMSGMDKNKFSYSANVDAKAFKFESFFKKKFSDKCVHGTEWFRYDDHTINYIRRMFKAIADSEQTALCRTKLIMTE